MSLTIEKIFSVFSGCAIGQGCSQKWRICMSLDIEPWLKLASWLVIWAPSMYKRLVRYRKLVRFAARQQECVFRLRSNVADMRGAHPTKLYPALPISPCCFVDVCAALRANKIKSCLIGRMKLYMRDRRCIYDLRVWSRVQIVGKAPSTPCFQIIKRRPCGQLSE